LKVHGFGFTVQGFGFPVHGYKQGFGFKVTESLAIEYISLSETSAPPRAGALKGSNAVLTWYRVYG